MGEKHKSKNRFFPTILVGLILRLKGPLGREGIFIFAIYFSFILLFRSDLDYSNKWFITFLISALGVYFIDANLNFPIARPQVLAPWSLTMALLVYYFNQYKKEKQTKSGPEI